MNLLCILSDVALSVHCETGTVGAKGKNSCTVQVKRRKKSASLRLKLFDSHVLQGYKENQFLEWESSFTGTIPKIAHFEGR